MIFVGDIFFNFRRGDGEYAVLKSGLDSIGVKVVAVERAAEGSKTALLADIALLILPMLLLPFAGDGQLVVVIVNVDGIFVHARDIHGNHILVICLLNVGVQEIALTCAGGSEEIPVKKVFPQRYRVILSSCIQFKHIEHLQYCLISSSYLIRNFDYIIYQSNYICKFQNIEISSARAGKSQQEKKISFSLFILHFFALFIQFIMRCLRRQMGAFKGMTKYG